MGLSRVSSADRRDDLGIPSFRFIFGFLVVLFSSAILILPTQAFSEGSSNSTTSQPNSNATSISTTLQTPSKQPANTNSSPATTNSSSPATINSPSSSQNATSQTSNSTLVVTNSPIATPSSNSSSTSTPPLSNPPSPITSSLTKPSNSTSVNSTTTGTTLVNATTSNTHTTPTNTTTLSPASNNATQSLLDTNDTGSTTSTTNSTATNPPIPVALVLNQPVSLVYRMDDSDGVPRVLGGVETILYDGVVDYSARYTTDSSETFHTSTTFSEPGSWTIEFTIDTVNGSPVNLSPMKFNIIVSTALNVQATTHLIGSIGKCILTLDLTQNSVSNLVDTTPDNSTGYDNIVSTTLQTDSSNTVTTRSQNGNYFARMTVLILDPKLILVHYDFVSPNINYVYHWGGSLTTEWNGQALGVEPIGLYGYGNNWVFGPTGVGHGFLTFTITDINRVNIVPDRTSFEINLPPNVTFTNLGQGQIVSTVFIPAAPVVNTQTTPSNSTPFSSTTIGDSASAPTSPVNNLPTTSNISFVSETLPAATLSNPNPAIQSDPQSAVIPPWIKTAATWWSHGQVKDDVFAIGMQYMVQNGIMKVPKDPQSTSGSSQQIPTWIKNNASWWVNGQIPDKDFVNGMQYMISNGIIKLNV